MDWLPVFLTGPEVLAAAFLLDLLLGDPRRLPHPVVGMGKAALFWEKPLRRLGRAAGSRGELAAGACLVVLIAGGSFLLSGALLAFLFARGPWWAGWSAAAWLVYSTIAVKSLGAHARAVARPLAGENLPAARRAVGMIVGRDVESLNGQEVARAAVESVAENASDGVVAPLLYAAVGGAPLALAYRAVNTLDAMYGHRTRANLYFGRAAARLDDFLNYLPARLTALLFLAAGSFLGKGPFTAWRVLCTDGHKHPSPNSGRPEAAMAGLLGIRLGGKSSYHGEVTSRPYLNASGRPAAAKDIAEAIKIVQLSSVLALALSVLISLVVSKAVWTLWKII